jgi:molecular chaperone DnaK
MSKIIGIDLGTSNSCVAVVESGEAKIIPNAEGNRTTPSVVAFTKDGERLVGQSAKRQAITNPENTIFSAKRLIGRKFDEIKDEIGSLPYKVIKGSKGEALIEITHGEGQQLAPEVISSMILAKLKTDAESYLGETVVKAVITVPAYFNDDQRKATKDAGDIAGLDVVRIINEPTAAALAYGLEKKGDQTIAVYDLGGGTFDVSLLEIADGVFEVRATNGDTQLGGDDWDEKIIDWLVTDFKKQEGIDLTKDSMAMQRLKEEAEKVKHTLSSSQSTDINLPFITATDSGPKHLTTTLTRSKLEKICDDLYTRTKTPFNNCLTDCGSQTSDIDEVVLVGGMTRSPKIVSIVEEMSGKKPHQGVNPDEVVASGAAIQGAVLQGDVNDVLLLDVTPLTLGIETSGKISTPMIERNSTIPTKKSQIFSTAENNQPAVDIVVLQGERAMSSDNKTLGTFKLDGIPPSPRGAPQIEVTFDIDVNGLINVSAKELGSGKDQKITISGDSSMSEEEIEKMKQDAEKYAEEDKIKREFIQEENELDGLVYQSESQLEEHGDKIDDNLKEELNTQISKCKDLLKGDTDIDSLRSAKDELSKTIQKIGQSMNESTAKEPEKKRPKDADIIDAEVEDVE